MAIIIEHMEMPNGCCECRMQTENCCTLSLRKIDDIYDRPEWCLLTEAKPVKHGKWIEDEYGIPHCSNCGTINNTVYRNYCPNCGSDMREVEE